MESTVWPLEMAYEHRNYLPAIAVCLFLGVLIEKLGRRVEWLRFRVVASVLLVVFLLPLGLRASLWSNEITLARHNVLSHPDSPRANFFYANAIYKAFGQADTLDLSDKERGAYLVTAREYYLRMYKLNPRDFAPIVMLHQIENNYFSEMPDRKDWLGTLETLAATRIVQSSDRTALRALVEYSKGPVSEKEKARILAVIEILLGRYPYQPYLLINNLPDAGGKGGHRRER